MNKSLLIVTFSHLRCCPRLRRDSLGFLAFAIGGLILAGTLNPATAQDSPAEKAADTQAADTQAAGTPTKAAPAYPLAVAVSGNDVYTVDLDLPGVWKSGDATVLFAEGTKLLRKPMNRSTKRKSN